MISQVDLIKHSHDPLKDTDPDVNILENGIAVTENTKCFTVEQFINISKNRNSLYFMNVSIKSILNNLDAFNTIFNVLNYSFL